MIAVPGSDQREAARAGEPEGTGPRFLREGPVEIAVVIVTFNSEGEISSLLQSLRSESEATRLRVIVVDNSSDDATLQAASEFADVVCIQSGGNLGYAGAINVGSHLVGQAEYVMILNPDSVVVPGCLAALRRPFLGSPQQGVTVPRLVDESGQTAISLFHEPSVGRALCDAIIGRFWRTRPPQFSEWDRRPASYARHHDVDWACGAALLMSTETAAAVGPWDEQFFLYSEETDFLRRVRAAGFDVTYVPDAVVHHSQGKSGTSSALDALVSVNRIRYMRKHAPHRAGAYRLVVILNLFLRCLLSRSVWPAALVVMDERRWTSLPRASAAQPPRLHHRD